MNPNSTPVTTSAAPADQQLADIKSQAAKIVRASQKLDPSIKIATADAEMIGLPKVQIPTTKTTTPRPTELDRVGTTPLPKTSQDIARETILSQVPEADRDTIDQILSVATGFQTEKGRALESTADSLMTQQLANIQSTRDKAIEGSRLKEAAMIPELQAELESIRGEADVLEARRNSAIQAEARREGLSQSAREGNINTIDRDFNLDKANLAIRELASVGKINAATKLIDTKLDLKYGDLEAETELLTAQLNAISPFLNREDQKAAETRLQLNEIVKTKIADAREADKALEEFKLQSYIFAQQNGATPATLSQIMSSTSREDVASVGGTFIQDPMQKLQMEATRADIANTYNQISDRNTRLKLAQEAATLETQQAIQAGLTENEAAAEKALGMFAMLNELAVHPGFGSAVGPNVFARGFSPTGAFSAFGSGDRSEFISLADQIANTLTLDNMDKLKGPATDKDVDLVAASVSKLKNRDMSQEAYGREITSIAEAMKRIAVNKGASAEQLKFYGMADDTQINEFDSLFGGTSQSTPSIQINTNF